MSNRERCIAILDSLTDEQLGNIAVMLQAAKDAIDDAVDDVICEKLYQKYLQDPDRGESESLEDVIKGGTV